MNGTEDENNVMGVRRQQRGCFPTEQLETSLSLPGAVAGELCGKKAALQVHVSGSQDW